jgi:hypothetical protein
MSAKFIRLIGLAGVLILAMMVFMTPSKIEAADSTWLVCEIRNFLITT